MSAPALRTHGVAVMLLVVSALTACSGSGELNAHAGLAERIAAYYELEKQQRWAEAWTIEYRYIGKASLSSATFLLCLRTRLVGH